MHRYTVGPRIYSFEGQTLLLNATMASQSSRKHVSNNADNEPLRKKAKTSPEDDHTNTAKSNAVEDDTPTDDPTTTTSSHERVTSLDALHNRIRALENKMRDLEPLKREVAGLRTLFVATATLGYQVGNIEKEDFEAMMGAVGARRR